MRIFDDRPVGEASAPTWPVNAVSEHAAKRVATRSRMLFFLSVVCSIALFSYSVIRNYIPFLIVDKPSHIYRESQHQRKIC